ncbi:agouti signaling protein 1 isoform X1 [Xyrauchen texanus]|uniref:agouti signaling protein 1 isoform X1 n=1 Tax=Xyrauchen texanus TaxID=154827 RepID=UPI0022419711|nr:agouti signaling protein 1 isoform X1 [Xyrauchen texanus]XP_051986563.1 agouti signaling protein 1 isoform X1 [Xyrauchen texanus]
MNPSLLLCGMVLCLACCVTVHTHMLMEEQHNSNQTSISFHMLNQTDAPPVLIVGLSKTPMKNKKSEKKPKKNKFSARDKKPLPPPPPNCVPLWGSCKTPSAVCCEPCAFCHCRMFKTVCYCRMGYPRC